MEGLEQRGVAGDTLLAFVSDHGEEFLDHGWGWHGNTVYGEAINVPLILHWPSVLPAGMVVDPTWTGRGGDIRVVSDQELPANASHAYVVVVHAQPTLFVAEDDLACLAATPGHGYFNGAVLTSGADVLTDDACAPIPTTDLPTLPLPPDLPTLALTGTTVGGGLLGALGLLVAGLLLLAGRRSRATPRHSARP